MIDDILSLLDTPRQAITNLARTAFGAEDTDIMSALPGLLGALGTGMMAATGAGLPLAVLMGSGFGGLAQAAGNASGLDSFRAPSSEEVSKNMFGSDEFIPSFIAGLLTDPLTYAGGIGGARAGAKMGSKVGADIEQQALMRGPRYTGGESNFLDAVTQSDAALNRRALAQNPNRDPLNYFSSAYGNISEENLANIVREIPEGSSFLGSGSYGMAMKSPTGDVIRVSPFEAQGPGIGRPDVSSVLGATRSVDFIDPSIKSGGIRVERVPFAETAPHHEWSKRRMTPDPGSKYGFKPQNDYEELAERASREGLNPWDIHSGNLGRHEGQVKFIDPGAYDWNPDFVPYKPSLVYSKPSRVDEMIHRMIGSTGRVRKNIETGADVGIEDMIRKMGTGMGAGVGVGAPALARSFYE